MGRTRTRRSSEDGQGSSPKRSRHRYSTRLSSRNRRLKLLGGDQPGRKVNISDEEFRDRNKVLKEDTKGKPLIFKSLDNLLKENRAKHHTDEFDQEDLIVRRGEEFSLKFSFDRNVDASTDVLLLQFSFGARPQESKETLIRVPVSFDESSSTKDDWSAIATKVDEKDVTVTIKMEPDSKVGKYEIFVESKVKDSKEDASRKKLDDPIYILFNPWCKEDLVYVENDAERHEYVMLETGYIWTGSARRNGPRPWNFGQFDTPVLEVALKLIELNELGDSVRNSPISVVRCLSAMVNCTDEKEDFGLLVGRWTSDYPKESTKPWEWTGSVDICQRFIDTGKPVEFGQCWVFSGVVTTLLRCLGIPTRSVTNFESAHDCDCSMTIDKHYDEDGKPLDDENDSVWNFHVWNESWFRRIDLPDEYSGWQAHDATPQELSDGVSRCGPASVHAIKKGDVYLNFDAGFIFAEVNGDKCYWTVKEDGSMTCDWIDHRSVGKQISTKAVGMDELHDLTLDYKYRDGTPEEQAVLKTVNKFSTRRRNNIYKLDLDQQMELDLIIPEDAQIGSDIVVGVKVTNKTSDQKNVKVKVILASTYYTGVVGKSICDEVFEKSLEKDATEVFEVPVTAKAYEVLMNSAAEFKLTAVCKVLETKRMFHASEAFDLDKFAEVFEVPVTAKAYEVLMNSAAEFKLTSVCKVLETKRMFHASEAFDLFLTPFKILPLENIVENEEIASEVFEVPVTAKTYEVLMNSAAEFKLTAVCKVLETKRMFHASEAFDLDKPFLSFKIPDVIPSYTDLTIPVTFENKTDMKLHHATIHCEGSFLVKDKDKSYKAGKTLYPGDHFTIDIAINSRRLGARRIMATFSSDELANVFKEGIVNCVSKNDYKKDD